VADLGYGELLALATAPLLLILCTLVFALILSDLSRRLGDCREGGHAEQKAVRLLKEWLSPAQLAQYEREGHFEVTGSHSGRRYNIRQGRQANIVELDEHGERVASWCFAPEGTLAIGDIMLAQKIALETNESAALIVANRSR
jgi:hypothetical protein